MMAVLVTGAAGFIGRRLVARLLREGREVLALDCRDLPAEWPRAHCRRSRPGPAGGRLPVRWLAQHPGFCLVHLAWQMDRDRNSFSGEARNVELHAQVLEQAVAGHVARVVGLGSAAEYAQREGCLRESQRPTGEIAAYGWAKCCARELSLAMARQHHFQLWWLRPFIVYGPGQQGQMLIPSAIQAARAGQEAPFSDGRQKRDFVYVDDVVDAMVRAITSPATGNHVVNIGTGTPVAMRCVLAEIATQFAGRARFHLGGRPRRRGEPEVQYADIHAAEKWLGWRARVDWKTGLRMACGGTT